MLVTMNWAFGKQAGWTPLVCSVGLLIAATSASAQHGEYTLQGQTWVETKPPASAPEVAAEPAAAKSADDTERPAPQSDEEVIREARRLLAENDGRRAKNLLDPWIDTHERTSNPYLPEAYLLRGDALLAEDMEYTALYDYEAIAKKFPQSEAFPYAVEREFDIAMAYANGKKRRVFGLRLWDATDIAIELLIRVQERLPGSTIAERASIELADYYYRTRDIELAGEAYSLYVENHPRGPNRMKAEQRRIYCDIARFKGPEYDASGLLDAQVRIRNFQNRYRAEAEQAGLTEGLIARLDESLAAQMLESAEWYLQTRDEPSARVVLRRLIQEQPGTLASQRGLEIMQNRGWIEASATPVAEPTPPAINVEGPQKAIPVEPSSESTPTNNDKPAEGTP